MEKTKLELVISDYRKFACQLKQSIRLSVSTVVCMLCVSTVLAGYSDPFSLAGFTFTNFSKVTVVDLDYDGDNDVVIGESTGILRFFEYEQGDYIERTGIDNPLNGIVESYSSPAFADLDNDGDLDLVVGDNAGIFNFYENIHGVYTLTTGADNPFDGHDLGTYSTPEFADVDDDDDMDMIAGSNGGTIYYYNNEEGVFTEKTGADNPFDAIDVGTYSDPVLIDLDGDGDLDLVSGTYDQGLVYYENQDGVYIEQTAANNPFDGFLPEKWSSPAVADFDGDGDLDAIAGDEETTLIHYYANEGSSYVEVEGTGNPFDGLSVSSAPYPAFGDYDDDGEDELLVGHLDGSVSFFENDGLSLHSVEVAQNPFSALTFGGNATPAWGDVDGDGDIDLIAGNSGGTIQYIVNDAGTFSDVTGTGIDPFDEISITEGNSAPIFYDYEGDDDLDLFIGTFVGTIYYFENVEGAFLARTGVSNPFDGVDVTYDARLAFKDVDGDNDVDMVLGDNDNNEFHYFENTEGDFVEKSGFENPFINISANRPSPAFFDINNDGMDDFVFGDFSSELFVAYYMEPRVSVQSEPVLNTSEDGSISVIALSLESQPLTDVYINVISTNMDEGKAIPNFATFTTSNWDEPQYIEVVGQDDDVADHDKSYEIEFLVESLDAEYDSLPVASLPAVNVDDDDANVLNSYTANDVRIFANEGIITINALGIQLERVDVYSISGSLVLSRNINSEGTHEIDMNGANAGMYIVRAYSNGEVTNAKVVIR